MCLTGCLWLQDDLEEPEKFEVNQQVLAWDKGGKINRHTGSQTNARWGKCAGNPHHDFRGSLSMECL